MRRGVKHNLAKTGNNSSAPTAGASAATRTRAKPDATAHRVPLPHTWMLDGRWKIDCMLNKIEPSEYLSEARRFEADALANGTLSEDWPAMWRAHCRRRLVTRYEAGKPEVEPASLGLFDWS